MSISVYREQLAANRVTGESHWFNSDSPAPLLTAFVVIDLRGAHPLVRLSILCSSSPARGNRVNTRTERIRGQMRDRDSFDLLGRRIPWSLPRMSQSKFRTDPERLGMGGVY